MRTEGVGGKGTARIVPSLQNFTLLSNSFFLSVSVASLCTFFLQSLEFEFQYVTSAVLKIIKSIKGGKSGELEPQPACLY